MRARAVAALLVALVALGGGPGPAVAQAPPTVTIDASPGSLTSYRSCDGWSSSLANYAILTLERDQTTGPLTVALSYTGDMQQGTDFTAPPSVTIADGETSAVATAVPNRGGTFTATIEPGPYAIGQPGSVDVAVDEAVALECRRSSHEQTIRVGSAPAAVEVGEVADTAFGLLGDPPPGLDLDRNGAWTGAATTVGTYRFRARWCLRPDPEALCIREIDATIHVVPADGTAASPVSSEGARGAPTAAPATPISASPTFTG